MGLQVDIAQLSTYQPRFEPAVLATSHPRPKPLEASGIPRSPPASPQRDPPRLWEVHRQPAGCYQWLGDRIKAVLLVLAILGLVVQLFTLQPYHGPGVSPFAPRHVKQAHQPLLQQVRLHCSLALKMLTACWLRLCSNSRPDSFFCCIGLDDDVQR